MKIWKIMRANTNNKGICLQKEHFIIQTKVKNILRNGRECCIIIVRIERYVNCFCGAQAVRLIYVLCFLSSSFVQDVQNNAKCAECKARMAC